MRRSKYGREKTGTKPGSIIELLTNKYESDKLREKERRLAKEENDKAKMAKKHLNKSIKFNISVCGRTLGENTCGIRFEFESIGSQEGCLPGLPKASV